MRIPFSAAFGAATLIGTIGYTIADNVLNVGPVQAAFGDLAGPFIIALVAFFLVPALALLGRSRIARGWLSLAVLAGAAFLGWAAQFFYADDVIREFPIASTVTQIAGVIALWFPGADDWFNRRDDACPA